MAEVFVNSSDPAGDPSFAAVRGGIVGMCRATAHVVSVNMRDVPLLDIASFDKLVCRHA